MSEEEKTVWRCRRCGCLMPSDEIKCDCEG